MIIKRIEELTKEKRWSRRELERQAGISVGSISKWSKVNPTQANLQKVANALNVSVAYLTGESEYKNEHEVMLHRWNSEMNPSLPDEVKRIEAGIRIPVFEEIDVMTNIWVDIPESLAATGTFFGYVLPQTLSSRFQTGDVLIIREQNNGESGDVVLINYQEQTPTCMRIIKFEDEIILQSITEPNNIIFTKDKNTFQILGKVVENRQKF